MQGLASTFLNRAKPGDIVSFALVTAASFHLPMDPACPAVYVAAGTGIAPFRSFWEERKARLPIVKSLAPTILVFGCRTKNDDAMYAQVRHSPSAPPTIVACCLRRK